jgi:phosphate transport system substrate-binding protein
MRASFPKLAVVVLAGLLATESAAAAEALQLGGTGTGSAIGMLRQVGAEFSAATGIKIDVIPSLGTTGAIRALKDGVLDIAVAARPLTADEAATGLHQVDVVRTPYVMATSLQKPNGLKKRRPSGDFHGR